MEEYELLEFYKFYPINHWIEKLTLMKNYIENYDSIKDVLQKDLVGVNKDKYINMLKSEIHFTYFQIVEALFELIFALENHEDINLWYYLSFSKWKENYKRIEDIAKGNITFLHEHIKLENGKLISMTQYIFYFLLKPPISDSEMKRNIIVIEDAIGYFAKDFSDRNDYNAYKHSLRFYQSSINLSIIDDRFKKEIAIGGSENTFTFLGKDDEGKLISIVKSFDPERDFKMADICHKLISNVITTRKLYYHGAKEQEPIFYFYEYNLLEINKPSYNLINLKKTVFWDKSK